MGPGRVCEVEALTLAVKPRRKLLCHVLESAERQSAAAACAHLPMTPELVSAALTWGLKQLPPLLGPQGQRPFAETNELICLPQPQFQLMQTKRLEFSTNRAIQFSERAVQAGTMISE